MESQHCIPASSDIIDELKKLSQAAQAFSTKLSEVVQQNQAPVSAESQEAVPAAESQEAVPAAESQEAVPAVADEELAQGQQINNLFGQDGGRTHKRRMHRRNKTHRKKVRTFRKKNKVMHKKWKH